MENSSVLSLKKPSSFCETKTLLTHIRQAFKAEQRKYQLNWQLAEKRNKLIEENLTALITDNLIQLSHHDLTTISIQLENDPDLTFLENKRMLVSKINSFIESNLSQKSMIETALNIYFLLYSKGKLSLDIFTFETIFKAFLLYQDYFFNIFLFFFGYFVKTNEPEETLSFINSSMYYEVLKKILDVKRTRYEEVLIIFWFLSGIDFDSIISRIKDEILLITEEVTLKYIEILDESVLFKKDEENESPILITLILSTLKNLSVSENEAFLRNLIQSKILHKLANNSEFFKHEESIYLILLIIGNIFSNKYDLIKDQIDNTTINFLLTQSQKSNSKLNRIGALFAINNLCSTEEFHQNIFFENVVETLDEAFDTKQEIEVINEIFCCFCAMIESEENSKNLINLLQKIHFFTSVYNILKKGYSCLNKTEILTNLLTIIEYLLSHFSQEVIDYTIENLNKTDFSEILRTIILNNPLSSSDFKLADCILKKLEQFI